MRYSLLLGVVLLALVALAAAIFVASPARAAALDPGPGTGCTGSYYVVQLGDHLYRLAIRFGTTVSAITRCNHLSDPDQIYAGQRLLIPDGSWGAGTCSCSSQPCNCPPAPSPTPTCPPGTATPCNCPTATPTPTPTATPVACNCASCGCPTPAPPVIGCTCTGCGCSAPPQNALPAQSKYPAPRVSPGPAACTCPGVAGAPCNCDYRLTPGPYGRGSYYVVLKGDTLYSLARRWGTTVNAIMAANGLTDPNRIRSGQTLRMP